MNQPLISETQLVREAELESLIASAMAALRDGGAESIQELRLELTRFDDDNFRYPNLQDKARKALHSLNAGQVDAGRQALAELTESIGGQGRVFAAAARIAESGGESLLFPRLAATASSLLELVGEFQKTVDELKRAGGEVARLSDVFDLLEGVRSSLQRLKRGVEESGD